MAEKKDQRRLYSTEDGIIMLEADMDLVLTPDQKEVDDQLIIDSRQLDIPDRVSLLKQVREEAMPVLRVQGAFRQSVDMILGFSGNSKFDREVQGLVRGEFENLKDLDRKIGEIKLFINMAVSTLMTLPRDFYRIEQGEQLTFPFEDLMNRLVDTIDVVEERLDSYRFDWTNLQQEPEKIEEMVSRFNNQQNLEKLLFEYKYFVHNFVEFLDIMIGARVDLAVADLRDTMIIVPEEFSLFRNALTDSLATLESLQIVIQQGYRSHADLMFDKMELLNYLKHLRGKLIRILVKVREFGDVFVSPELNIEALNDVMHEDFYNRDLLLTEIEAVKKMIVYFRRRLRFR